MIMKRIQTERRGILGSKEIHEFLGNAIDNHHPYLIFYMAQLVSSNHRERYSSEQSSVMV